MSDQASQESKVLSAGFMMTESALRLEVVRRPRGCLGGGGSILVAVRFGAVSALIGGSPQKAAKTQLAAVLRCLAPSSPSQAAAF